MASEIEFDWNDENRKHLAAHKVAPAEFEQLLNNDPLDLDYELIDNEERYRTLGLTNGGRLSTVAWTIRNGKNEEAEREATQARHADFRNRGGRSGVVV